MTTRMDLYQVYFKACPDWKTEHNVGYFTKKSTADLVTQVMNAVFHDNEYGTEFQSTKVTRAVVKTQVGTRLSQGPCIIYIKEKIDTEELIELQSQVLRTCKICKDNTKTEELKSSSSDLLKK